MKSRPPWPPGSVVDPVFSTCGRYRYALSEIWDASRPVVLWVLMNPSVACVEYSDPTPRKTGKYARAWGYGGQLIGNVYAYRATDAKRLLTVDDPIGPENDQHPLRMAGQAREIVLAYGKPPKKLQARGRAVVDPLAHHPMLTRLRILNDGVAPQHPLYLANSLTTQLYSRTER